MDADVIVIGAGLAGLTAATEVADAGKKVIVLDQEPEASLGGQAFWSFGGLMFVNSPEQRRLGIRDSRELAMQDWLGAAGFDRDEDHWPRRWADAYVDFAAGEKRPWLHAMGVRWFPVVGWAERGGYHASGHGNSVPRFHITWGTGPALDRAVRAARARGGGTRIARVPFPPSRYGVAREVPARSTASKARFSNPVRSAAAKRVRAESSEILRSRRRQ